MSYKFKRITIPCPLCQSNSHRVRIKPKIIIDDPAKLYSVTSGIPGTQNIVECNDCTLIYENPRFPSEIIYNAYKIASGNEHDSQFFCRVKSFLRALNKNKKYLPPPGSQILDVGSAGGAFLKAAEIYGYKAKGLEPSEALVQNAKSRGLNAIAGQLETMNFNDESFDMICFWDVLEHLPDPLNTLKRARKYLRPKGILLVNFPDIGTWMAKCARSRFWFIVSVHLVHFDQKTIKKIASSSSFHPLALKPYWQTLEIGHLLNMLSCYLPRVGSLIIKILPSFIKKLKVSYYASQTTFLAVKEDQ